MAENLVVKAKIKDVAKGYNVASDVADAINNRIEQLIKDGCRRAESNARKTLMGKDI